MRIIGYIEHPNLKITVFKNEGKVSVQLESGLNVQLYKFRDGEGVENGRDHGLRPFGGRGGESTTR